MVELVRSNPIGVFALIAVNIAMSLWAYYADPIINNDGVVYISVAQLMIDGQWNTALESYGWPAYPGLIALLAMGLHVDAETAALVLNTGLVILLTIAFTSIVGELSNRNHRCQRSHQLNPHVVRLGGR